MGWRHWECVSPKLLKLLGSVNALQGFDALRSEDQSMVQNCLEVGRIEGSPSDLRLQQNKRNHDSLVEAQAAALTQDLDASAMCGGRFVVIGKFQDNLKEAYIAAIRHLGGTTSTSVSGTTTHVLIGAIENTITENSSNFKKAKQNAIPFITEQAFKAFLAAGQKKADDQGTESKRTKTGDAK